MTRPKLNFRTFYLYLIVLLFLSISSLGKRNGPAYAAKKERTSSAYETYNDAESRKIRLTREMKFLQDAAKEVDLHIPKKELIEVEDMSLEEKVQMLEETNYPNEPTPKKHLPKKNSGVYQESPLQLKASGLERNPQEKKEEVGPGKIFHWNRQHSDDELQDDIDLNLIETQLERKAIELSRQEEGTHKLMRRRRY